MARVPAICEKCYTVFPSPVNLGNGATNIVFKGCRAGPCPNCGGNSTILDGVYGAVGDAVEAFVGQQSVDVLKRLLKVLETAKRDQLKREEIIANIKQTTPELSGLGDCLPKTRMELYYVIMIIITLLGILINYITESGNSSFTKEELTRHTEVIINNYYKINGKSNSLEKPTSLSIADMPGKREPVGRNAPCPCGSGKKYKRCCGK